MKNILLIAALMITVNASAQTAKIYFVRNDPSKGMSAMVNSHIFVDKEKKCTIKNGEVGMFEIAPGLHSFAGAYGKSDLSAPLKINIEAGKSYYFVPVPLADLWEVTEVTSTKLLSTAREKDCALSIAEK